MKTVQCIVAALSVCFVVAVDFDPSEPLERDEIIKTVNSGESTWVAGRNFNPSFKKSYVDKLLGLKKDPGDDKLPVLFDDDEEVSELPKSFDARKKWRKCISLQQVRDQGPCGSCWAVAAAAAFTDRLCIASKMAWNGHLSEENVLSCCAYCATNSSDGCQGGNDDYAWTYFMETGIVTGGDYGSQEGCQPYELPTCEHHVKGKRENCTTYGDLPAPQCQTTCYNTNYNTSYEQDLHRINATFMISNDLKLIQKEIFKHGPVEAGFTVYEDFLSYKKGVYQHKTGSELGGHAVKVIGWGTERGTPYWLVANSWNSDWGDKGFFKIRRGNDECGFEEDISGGYPTV